jgi:hypothetical protein
VNGPLTNGLALNLFDYAKSKDIREQKISVGFNR